MSLAQNLRNITRQLNQQAQQQVSTAQAGNTLQIQQALTEQAAAQAPGQVVGGTLQAAQQMAPAIIQAQAQPALQAQQQVAQEQAAAAQQAIGLQQAQAQRALQKKAMLTDDEIKKRQEQGQLRQNSAELKQAKQLQQDDIDLQQRMQQRGFAYDNKISFLTRKQREDLSQLGTFVRQQVFDSRLQFKIEEGKRAFSNERQLADFAVATAISEQQLQTRMRAMSQAYEKEMIMINAAQQKIMQQLEIEFKKSEQEKNQALIKKLQERRNALIEKQKRKQANSNMFVNIISEGSGIAAATFAVLSGNPQFAPAAYYAGKGGGKMWSSTLANTGEAQKRF